MRYALCYSLVCDNRRKSAVSMFSPNLAPFASLRLAPWNTVSTEVQLFTPSVIPQGESSSLSSLSPWRFDFCVRMRLSVLTFCAMRFAFYNLAPFASLRESSSLSSVKKIYKGDRKWQRYRVHRSINTKITIGNP